MDGHVRAYHERPTQAELSRVAIGAPDEFSSSWLVARVIRSSYALVWGLADVVREIERGYRNVTDLESL